MSKTNIGANTLVWKDVANIVAEVNPKFASLVNEINPGDKYTVYKISYSFGSYIMKDGKFVLPNDLPSYASIEKDLSDYKSMPLSLVLKNASEVFLDEEEKLVPFTIYTTGEIASLWRNLDENQSFQDFFRWNRVAGCRSVFLLPKVTDSGSHARLQKSLQTDIPKPQRLEEQWNIFKDIYMHLCTAPAWETELLVFSRNWVDSILKDPEWVKLKCHLLDIAWKDTAFWRNEMTIRYIFGVFLKKIEDQQGKKIRTKTLAIFRKLILIALGYLPAFAPAIDDSELPAKCIRKAYIDKYKLQKYIPTIMVPKHFEPDQNGPPVYYSLQWDFLYEPYHEDKTQHNVIDVLEEVDVLLKAFINYLTTDAMSSRFYDTPLTCLMAVEFTCFHSSDSTIKNIHNSKEIPNEDYRFTECFNQQNNVFCYSSHFLRGCIRIAHKKR